MNASSPEFCGGRADRFDLDPSIVRVAWVLLGILTAIVPLLLIYLLMAIVVPEEAPGLPKPMAGRETNRARQA